LGTVVYNTYDLYGTYSPSDKFTIRLGVSNFTDELSVRVSSSQWSTDPALYDPTGRQWYLGMSFSFVIEPAAADAALPGSIIPPRARTSQQRPYSHFALRRR
jgi:hypothetical protein